LRASKLAGLREIPGYIREADDEQILTLALIENIQREDLTPLEVALGYERMMDELGLTQMEVAGKSRVKTVRQLQIWFGS
jgi:ParB family transcriptional regulator, chromosome partitioning protein